MFPEAAQAPHREQGRLLFNPKEPTFLEDPYPHYKRLRELDPVHRSNVGVWFVGKYDHVREVLRDTRFRAQDIPGKLRKKSELFKTKKVAERQPESLDHLVANSENWFAFLEAPDHKRLRKLVVKAFQKHSAERLRPYIRDCARGLLDEARARGEIDLIRDFACVIPRNVIATLLGLPPEDFPTLAKWIEPIGRIFDPFLSLDDLAELEDASRELISYLRALIERRRRAPQDDLISALIEARDEHDSLSEAELISIIIFNFGAGEETVINMIGNSTLALIRNPEKKEYLRSHPEIIDKAVEELLRYDSPLQMTSRTVTEDLELGGKQLRKGEQVYVALGSANRDPDAFSDPDELVLDRDKNHHMSFADGRHLCAGASLARIEAQEVLCTLLEMAPNIQAASQRPVWKPHIVLRGLRSLPVRLT